MAAKSKRAIDIDAFIDAHETCKKSKQKVEISGKIETLESYLLPITYLQYNHANGRFNLEIQEHETTLGRKLDPNDKKDVEVIRTLLLHDEVEAKKLYDDLESLGEQREVAAITHDGVVVNGNRRMATIEKLHEKYPSKWTELWVVRLPEDISEKDLWKIEAGLQLSKEKVAEYGPVNNLLMIKEGKNAGLSNAEIAASMYGWSEKQVASDLERLDLIDIFLQFFGQPFNYGLIKRFKISEHFINIQKGLVDKLKAAGIPKKEILKKLEIVFVYLRANILKPEANITHLEVRNICKILEDEKAADALTESFPLFKDLKNVPIDSLIDNLDKAKDIKKNREYELKPGKLIDKAISALNGIDRDNKHFKSDMEVKSKLSTLDTLVRKMKAELGLN